MYMRKDIPKTEFGERLRQLRREKGLTQAQLASLSGISARMIAHYENYVKMPPIGKVKKLSEALTVTTDDLVGTTKPSKKQTAEEKTSYSLMKRLRVVEKLPIRDQKVVFSLINSLAAKNKMKGKL